MVDARPHPVVAFGPYVVLGMVIVFTLVGGTLDAPGGTLDLVLVGAAACWMLGGFTVNRSWRSRPRMMIIFVAVLLIIVTALVIRQPTYGVFAIAGYIYSFGAVPWPWRLAAVAWSAVLAATAQASDVDKSTVDGFAIYLIIVAINVAAMSLLSWLHWRAAVLSEQRRQALEENTWLQAELVAQAHRAGTLEERQRLAREIHDTLAQGLVGIITQLQAAEQTAGDPGERRRHLQSASDLARESLAEARRSVRALQPERLQAGSLIDALRDEAARWSERTRICTAVRMDGSPRRLGGDQETVLLRAAQEALSNVARHARAGHVAVTLSYLPGQVMLDVSDDGVGFDPAAAGDDHHVPWEAVDHGGFGLEGMRQRVTALGGALQLEAAPGHGTVVSVALPAGAGTGVTR